MRSFFRVFGNWVLPALFVALIGFGLVLGWYLLWVLAFTGASVHLGREYKLLLKPYPDSWGNAQQVPWMYVVRLFFSAMALVSVLLMIPGAWHGGWKTRDTSTSYGVVAIWTWLAVLFVVYVYGEWFSLNPVPATDPYTHHTRPLSAYQLKNLANLLLLPGAVVLFVLNLTSMSWLAAAWPLPVALAIVVIRRIVWVHQLRQLH